MKRNAASGLFTKSSFYHPETERMSSPTSTRSVLARSPIIFFSGSGSFLSSVGMAIIWSPLASWGFFKRSIPSMRYFPARCSSQIFFKLAKAVIDFGVWPATYKRRFQISSVESVFAFFPFPGEAAFTLLSFPSSFSSALLEKLKISPCEDAPFLNGLLPGQLFFSALLPPSNAALQIPHRTRHGGLRSLLPGPSSCSPARGACDPLHAGVPAQRPFPRLPGLPGPCRLIPRQNRYRCR